MQPLIQSFTKNLSPCSGCGTSVIDYFIEQIEKGEKVKFVATIVFESENSRAAMQKMLALPEDIEVSGLTAQKQPSQAGQITGSQFQRTTTQPTNTQPTPQLQPNG